MLRVIREVQPRWVVGENVLGLVNWNGGLVFEEVQADLEAEGYEVQPFILPAASVNAPHKRDRVWFVAYKNAPDTDSNGFIEKRGHDSSGKNDAWSNAQGERTADTKNPNGCDSHGIPKEQSSVGSNISGKANVEKNKIAKPTRFCELDSTNNTERIVNEKQDFIVEGGTLVSERPSGVFSPVNRGLECNQNLFDGMGEMGASNDIPRIKSMDGPTPNTDHNGYATTENGQGLGEGNDRNKTGQNDAVEFEGRAVSDWVTPDTDSARISGQSINAGTSQEIRQGGKGFEKAWDIGLIGGWDNFPTQSPICSGNDGLPTELDGITFSKWRNESIKAGGNAIVPQVVYQIFKAINEYREKYP